MSAKTKKILSKAFSIVLSLTMMFGIMMPLVRVDSVAEATSSASSSSEPSTETNLSLFNSGVTSENGTWSNPNPAPNTYNNKGYDIYAHVSLLKTSRLGLSFTIEKAVTERSYLSISAFDVDEDYSNCSYGYERDYIYLVDVTANKSVKLDGHLSGQNNSWDNTVFTIDPALFTVGHEYYFMVEVACSGNHSCSRYGTVIRTVSLQLGVTGASAPVNEGIESADLSASISSSGVVSVALSAKAYESGSYTVEYKAVYSSNSAQKGGTQQTVTIPTTNTTFNATFSLDSGSQRGTYVITAFIKDGSGNVKATREITVSYGYLAVSYNSNGGSQNLPVDLNAYDPADEVTVLFDYIPSRVGYIFLGWAFESDATEPYFTENGNTSFSIASDVILYAIWAEESSDPTPPAPPITCQHDESEVIVDLAPTCDEQGSGHTECTLCGEVLSTVVIPANNHSYYVAAELTETCTTNGYVLFACHNCSYTRTQIIYATGHDFGGDHICDECGYEVESHTHDYTITVVDPTCTTLGYTVYDCACGHSYRVDYIDQTGHRWGSGEVTVNRTCTTDGITTYTCTLCSETRTEILPAGHDWSETTTVEKTCETDGEITKTCNDCGETETEVIPAGHTWSEGVVITEATCTEPGSKEVSCQMCGAVETHETDVLGHTFVNGRCTRCGAGIEDVVTPNEGHPEYGMYFEIDDILSNYGPDLINEYGVLLDYNEGANIKKVGVYLVQDGTRWRRCIACVGEGITYATYVPYLSYDEDIKYTGLNSPYINIFRLKENSDGIWCYSNYTTIGVNLQDAYGNLLLSLYDIGQAGAKTRVFDNLDEMIEWLKEPVSGEHTHKESEWIVDIVPTCVIEGQRHKECTDCKEILATEAIPTIDHTIGEWIIDKVPTCLEEGSQHTECTVCLTVIETVAIPTVNHTESEWIVKVAPTCIESGYQHRECTVCHNVLQEEYLPSTGVHTESEWIITTEPTTTSQGEKYKECADCHTILAVETISALAKIKVNGVVSRAGYTVNVTIDIQNNPGILGAILTMKYDSGLTLIGVSTGAAFNTLTFTEPGAYTSECNFVWDGDIEADYNNGTIITLTFKISEEAVVGDIFAIDLSYTEGNIVGEDLTPAEIYIENGNISIDNIRGDVNDDGIVDVADIIALRRYMAGGYNIEINAEQSDLNDDGIITILDIIQLREYILGI